jgi:hypothetical protein
MPVPEELSELRFWASAVVPNFARALNSAKIAKEFWLNPDDYGRLQGVLGRNTRNYGSYPTDPWAGIPVRVMAHIKQGEFMITYKDSSLELYTRENPITKTIWDHLQEDN